MGWDGYLKGEMRKILGKVLSGKGDDVDIVVAEAVKTLFHENTIDGDFSSHNDALEQKRLEFKAKIKLLEEKRDESIDPKNLTPQEMSDHEIFKKENNQHLQKL